MQQEWKKIEGWPRYSVSDDGQIRNDLTGHLLAGGVDNHLCTKLTPELVVNIRNLYASGQLSQQRIADVIGISQTHVGRIVRKTQWRQTQ